MQPLVPVSEIMYRLERFRMQMDHDHPGWELAAFFGKINLYYFTGTIQDGMLLIPRDQDPIFWVRRSYERATVESVFPDIREMRSFRDAAAVFSGPFESIHIETEIVPVAMLDRFRKHFSSTRICPLDLSIGRVRSVKSPFELDIMRTSGKIHREVLEDKVPSLLSEGIDEAAFVTDLYSLMVRSGHHGVVRFGMFDAEMVVGQVGFGESSLYPTCFDGPGGSLGLSPAVPLLGNRERKLHDGDLVFVDVGFGVDGYHTDKTMTYLFHGSAPEAVQEIHNQCVTIQQDVAVRLVPGRTPASIYQEIMDGLEPSFLENFMGFGQRTVRFLGHGIGLLVNELPVIAAGFDEPLEEGMVFALEPKKGVPGFGMVGIENIFIVTQNGGECITGKHPGLMPVW